jgi:hypothetical protein
MPLRFFFIMSAMKEGSVTMASCMPRVWGLALNTPASWRWGREAAWGAAGASAGGAARGGRREAAVQRAAAGRGRARTSRM